MTRWAWWVVAAICIVRAVIAVRLPLTGDEAYYWEWSKRLAFGYVDHPPAVAWLIRGFSIFGQSPVAVRIGFVACGAVAAIAAGRAATVLAEDTRAGAAAALALTLAPVGSLAFGAATPDGPFLAAWALALWFAARAARDGRRTDYVLLGCALGAALLSRLFGLALLAGIAAFALGARRAMWREGLGISFAIAALAFAPFLVWNAQHGWVNFAFALVHRQQAAQSPHPLTSLLSLLAGEAAAYSPGIWIAAVVCAVRPGRALIAWTALPLAIVVTLLALVREVEVYWLLGPFVSLCVAIGIGYARLRDRIRVRWATLAVAPAAALLGIAFAAALVPGPAYAAFARITHVRLKNAGPFEIFAFAPLARDVARIARARDAVVMTDGYGLSSVLDFDAGIPPVVIGYDWQGRESRSWYSSSEQPARALFVDKEPLDTRPDFVGRLAHACSRVVDGGVHAFRYGAAPPRRFYFTWCEGVVPNGIAILRWERAN
ncbi:MAG: ArnT family glycosyltransferase [Vulcanimicrobiaceae bacterium]